MIRKLLNIFFAIIIINTTFSVISVIAVAPSPGDLLRNRKITRKIKKYLKKTLKTYLKKKKSQTL